jgi:hypothetical protein
MLNGASLNDPLSVFLDQVFHFVHALFRNSAGGVQEKWKPVNCDTKS